MPSREHRVVCPRDCYDNCFLKVTVDSKGVITSVKADISHPITRGITCPRAAKDGNRVYKNRILYPHSRKDAKPCQSFKRISWNDALNTTTGKLREAIETHGPESVLLLDYVGNSGLLTLGYPQRIWNAIGATRTDYSLCAKSGHSALSFHYGRSYGIQPEDLLNQKLIVYWGFNAAVSSPHTWSLAKMAKRDNGASIIVVDSRRSRSAEQADIWVSPRPGTDVALAYGVARYLIENELIDAKFIKEWTVGYNLFKNAAMKWNSKTVEDVTGVKEEVVEEIGLAYGKLKPSATMMGVGFQKSVQGAESVRAVALLPALVGLHRGFFYSNSGAYFTDIPYLTGERFATRESKIVSQVALGSIMEQGDFKFVYIYNMNPALTVPNQDALRKGLSRNDVFVVVHETHWTETIPFADIVLPACTYLEKDDIAIAWAHRHVMISRKPIVPQGESRDEVWVMHEIAKRLEMREEWLYEPPWKAMEKTLQGSLETGTFADLVKGETLELKCRSKSEYQTQCGLIEFASKEAKKNGFSAVPIQIPVEIPDGQFILLTSALANYSHTQFQEIYGPIPSVVHIHPFDAEMHEIQDGNIVKLSNDMGEIQLTAVVSKSVPKGVLWTPSLGVGLKGKPQNSLISCITQTLGGGSTFNSSTVFLVKE